MKNKRFLIHIGIMSVCLLVLVMAILMTPGRGLRRRPPQDRQPSGFSPRGWGRMRGKCLFIRCGPRDAARMVHRC